LFGISCFFGLGLFFLRALGMTALRKSGAIYR
jgi:hypothetical protein